MSESTTLRTPPLRLFDDPPLPLPRQVLGQNERVRDTDREFSRILELQDLHERSTELANYVNRFRYPADSARVIAEILRRAAERDRDGLLLAIALLTARPGAEDVLETARRPRSLLRALRSGAGRDASAGAETSGRGEVNEREALYRRTDEVLRGLTGMGAGEIASGDGGPLLEKAHDLARALEEGWDGDLPHRELLDLELSWLELRSSRLVRRAHPNGRDRVSRALTGIEDRRRSGRWFLENPRPRRAMVLHEVIGPLEWNRILEAVDALRGGEFVRELLTRQMERPLLPEQLARGTGALLTISEAFSGQRPPTGTLDEVNAYVLLLRGLDERVVVLERKGNEDTSLLERIDTELGVAATAEEFHVRLDRLPGLGLHDEDYVPRRLSLATEKEEETALKTLIFMNLDNDTFLKEAVRNPKVVAVPGLIATIALRARAMGALSLIAGSRECYTGFANKDVPRNLLINPTRIPISSLRKFIHVRYVSRMDLQMMAKKSGDIRSDVKTEINRYLRSLANR
jgi:hypothetical protein